MHVCGGQYVQVKVAYEKSDSTVGTVGMPFSADRADKLWCMICMQRSRCLKLKIVSDEVYNVHRKYVLFVILEKLSNSKMTATSTSVDYTSQFLKKQRQM